MSLGSLTSSRKGLFALVAVGVAAYVLAVWFLFVSPKRAEAARLQQDVAAAEAQLAEAQAAASGSPSAPKTRVSDLFRLAKAMPSSVDQASLLLELDALARRANVTTASVTIQEPTTLTGGTTAIPVAVTVTGTFDQITGYLVKMRRLVGLTGDHPYATGRLLTVQSVDLTESRSRGFPNLDAAILLNAHAYDGPVAAPAPTTPPETTDDGQVTSSAAGATP